VWLCDNFTEVEGRLSLTGMSQLSKFLSVYISVIATNIIGFLINGFILYSCQIITNNAFSSVWEFVFLWKFMKPGCFLSV